MLGKGKTMRSSPFHFAVVTLISLVFMATCIPYAVGITCEISMKVSVGQSTSTSAVIENFNVSSTKLNMEKFGVSERNAQEKAITLSCQTPLPGEEMSCAKLTYTGRSNGYQVDVDIKDCVRHTGNLSMVCSQMSIAELSMVPAKLEAFAGIEEDYGSTTRGNFCACNTDECNSGAAEITITRTGLLLLAISVASKFFFK